MSRREASPPGDPSTTQDHESPADRTMEPLEPDDNDKRADDNHRGQPKRAAYEQVPTQDGDSEGVATAKQSLRRHFTVSAILGDCMAVLLPTGLVAFAIAVWRLDGREYVEGSLDTWRNAIIILATAYPILFASIVGRLMSAAAHWKLERGAEIGLLETLMGSRAVGSTILTLLQLRRVTFGAAALLVLWAVSPLGAQAFLRMLSTEQRTESVATNVTYFDNNSASRVAWNIHYADWYGAQLKLMSEVYSALLLTSPRAKASPADSWGNVKIPFLERGANMTANKEWQAVGESDVEYTSFLGVPVTDIFAPGNTSFPLESTYMDLRCSDITLDKEPPDVNIFDRHFSPDKKSLSTNGTWRGPCTETSSSDDAIEDGLCGGQWFLATDTFVGEYWHQTSHSAPLLTPVTLAEETGLGPRVTKLLFYAVVWNQGQVRERRLFSTTCRVQQKYVESRVHCVKEGVPNSLDTQPVCAVIAQRPSRLPHPPGDISFLSFPRNFWEIASRLPALHSAGGIYSADLSLHYLFNASTPVEGALVDDGYALDIDSISEHVIGGRLSQLLNTYLGATQLKLDAALGSFPPDSRSLSTLTQTEWFVEYVSVSLGWVLACLLACIVLLGAGVLGAIFSHRVRGPEVLGYVSSSVRDSRLLVLPAETRALDGVELTRHIREYRVRWGIVREADEMGIGREDSVERVK